jgi:ankyrin repeat protein
MTAEYINLLDFLSQDIYKLPKLSKKDICLEPIPDSTKIILFGFYEYYDELDKFDIEALNHFNMSGFFNINILMIAAYYNKIRLIKYLLARGVDINMSNKSGYNAYLFATSNFNVKIKVLKLLEDNGINIHKINDYLFNAFTMSIGYVKNYKIRTLEYLKSRGIDIHKLSYSGSNVYFYAQNIKICKYLEANGLNIHIKNTYNTNNYSFIIKCRNKQDKTIFRLLKYLKSRGVRNYYSENYDYCKINCFYKTLKHLLISNCNNRFKNITCYI